MRIARIEITRLAIPLRMTFTHALASRDHTDSLLVRVSDESGTAGYGESAPRRYVTGETVHAGSSTIRRKLAPPWLGAAFGAFEEVTGALSESQAALRRDEHAAFCALELAILDLAGRLFHRSAGDAIGPRARAHTRYSGVIPTADTDRALELCKACRKLGLESVKLKVGKSRQTDDALVEGARRILGADCSIRLDANGAWSADEALERIDAYRPHRLDGVEQPVPADDLDGLARVAAASPVPVIADESLVSYHDAERLIEARAAHVFNIRISKNGGLLGADRLRRLAAAQGLPWMLGAQVGETAILSAAGRHLATHTDAPRWCEGSFGSLLLSRDIAREDITFGAGGLAPAILADGLGITVRDDRLGRWEEVQALEGAGGPRPGGSR